MKKQLSLAIAIALGLSACGSSDSSSTPATEPKYNWQIVNLHVEDAADVAKDCVIYDNATSDPSKVVTASIALAGFNVLFHERDGSVISEYTITADDVPTTGIVSIDSANVPDGGYVSLEEVDGGIGGNADVYMFTVQKELLSDLVLNVRQPQTGASCYKGDQYQAVELSSTAAVSVLQETGINYYQSSYGTNVDGHSISANIPVQAELPASKSVLVTAFANDAEDQPTTITHYGLIDSDYIYDTNSSDVIVSRPLTNENLITQTWTTASNLTIAEESAIYMVANSNTYLWQQLFATNEEVALVDGSSEMQHWSAYFTGLESNYNWQYHSYIALDGANSIIDNTLPTLYDFNDVTVLNSCSSETSADYCIDTASFSTNEFDLQRTQVRSTTTVGGRNFYQSIYAVPNAQQVLMNSTVVTLDPDTSDRIEIGLTASDSPSQALEYMMAQSLNVQTAAEDSILVPEQSDTNGSIVSIADKSAMHQALLSTNSMMISNSIN
ncbi:hypothetical protein [Shewanella youngdeokensis]|uniref:Flagellar sheath protein A n=1 Tax=Shewanella youngdeokensis TaxID=2999068 RepID=A0ABZ0K0M6_9GAMM|nr:hypothetical protein RGE70_04665 [Shewanella sp. DAU334]